MTYRHATFKGSSSLLIGRDAYEHDLEVYFDGEVGYEDHGEHGREHIEIIDEVREVYLDGEPVSLQYLNRRFGTKRVDEAVLDAHERAEEY